MGGGRGVLGWVEEVRRHAVLRAGQGSTAGMLCDRFGFRGDRARTKVGDLSGGERRRLQLMRLLMGEPNVLLLDEPDQGFDRGTYVNFWDHCQTWRDAGKAVVVVTHMLAELERVDRVVELPVHPSRSAVGTS